MQYTCTFYRMLFYLMEILTHCYTVDSCFVIHINIFKKLISNHLKSILWPCLQQITGLNTSSILFLFLSSLILPLNILSSLSLSLYTWNQSMVQQLISEGNILSLFLNASPIGLIASTT